jgi:hypothetical protein
MFFTGFIAGVIITCVVCYCSIKDIKNQVKKLRGQVYYWSRQIPVSRKKRPKRKSV